MVLNMVSKFYRWQERIFCGFPRKIHDGWALLWQLTSFRPTTRLGGPYVVDEEPMHQRRVWVSPQRHAVDHVEQDTKMKYAGLEPFMLPKHFLHFYPNNFTLPLADIFSCILATSGNKWLLCSCWWPLEGKGKGKPTSIIQIGGWYPTKACNYWLSKFVVWENLNCFFLLERSVKMMEKWYFLIASLSTPPLFFIRRFPVVKKLIRRFSLLEKLKNSTAHVDSIDLMVAIGGEAWNFIDNFKSDLYSL